MNNDNVKKELLTKKADEAIKTRFRGHGANVTREEQGDCLKVDTVLKYLRRRPFWKLSCIPTRLTFWETQ